MGHGTKASGDSRNRGKENVVSSTWRISIPRNKVPGSCINTYGCLIDSKRITQLSNYTSVDSLYGRVGHRYNGAVNSRRADYDNTIHTSPTKHLKCYRCYGNHLVKNCVVKRGPRRNRRVPRPVLKRQSDLESSCKNSALTRGLIVISPNRTIQSDINNVNDGKFAKMSNNRVAKKIKCRNRSENRVKQLITKLADLSTDNASLKGHIDSKDAEIQALKQLQHELENRVVMLEKELKLTQPKKSVESGDYRPGRYPLSMPPRDNTSSTRVQPPTVARVRQETRVRDPTPVADPEDCPARNTRAACRRRQLTLEQANRAQPQPDTDSEDDTPLARLKQESTAQTSETNLVREENVSSDETDVDTSLAELSQRLKRLGQVSPGPSYQIGRRFTVEASVQTESREESSHISTQREVKAVLPKQEINNAQQLPEQSVGSGTIDKGALLKDFLTFLTK